MLPAIHKFNRAHYDTLSWPIQINILKNTEVNPLCRDNLMLMAFPSLSNALIDRPEKVDLSLEMA
jgi:hypothetical protein